jgi:hypothetical protein
MGLRPTLPPTRCSRMKAGCRERPGVCGQASQAPRHVPAAGGRDWARSARVRVVAIPRRSSRHPVSCDACHSRGSAASTMSRSCDRIFGVMAAPLLIVGEGGPTRSSGLHVGVAAKSSEADPTGDDVRGASPELESAVDLQYSSGRCAEMWSAVIGELLQYRRMRCVGHELALSHGQWRGSTHQPLHVVRQRCSVVGKPPEHIR